MDSDFRFDAAGLKRAVELLGGAAARGSIDDLPSSWPSEGWGSRQVVEALAPLVLGSAARLGDESSFAHMDPPTPWVSWALALWNASLNQNLLHPATAPVARDIERRVVDWLAPSFGMDGGHMTPGSTVANLTALWAARECAGVTTVLSSQSAHISIAKASHILGLRHLFLPVLRDGSLDPEPVHTVSEGELARSAFVLTAGITSTGAIDPLGLAGRAAWTHVDAAWAGPLAFSEKYAHRLAGIDRADSVSVSAHKWLFQPKESALVFFRQTARAHASMTFGGGYLAAPNVGVLGSHGATAAPLLATLLAWGRQGLASRIDRCMAMSERWSDVISREPRLRLLAPPRTGVVVWRPVDDGVLDRVQRGLPAGAVSSAVIGGTRWLRNVSANPNADLDRLVERLAALLDSP